MPRSDIDEQGLVLHNAPIAPLLVHFDDQYVWSFTPGRDGAVEDDTFRIAWPAALRPFLSGKTRVRIATYDAEVVLHDAEVTFGDGVGRVAFVDEQGAPYSIDKVGHLARAFEETSDDLKRELLDATQQVLRELKERCGVEAYLCYGALLGAVRQGTMLGHDSDVDLCYYSRHTTPADIITESFRIQRELRSLDWRILRMSAGDVKVLWPLSDGRLAHIDIFPAFTIDGTFYQFGNRNGRFDVDEHLLPLGTVELEGVEFPAPKHPEAMLAFVYGPSWRVPDPGFRYADSPIGTRRLDGWFRGFRTEVPLWAAVYNSSRAQEVPTGPSTFAAWVEPQLGEGSRILELGAGTGRDALWFASEGHSVLATDFSIPALTLLRQRRDALAESRVELELLAFNETRRVMSFVVPLSREPHHLYARGLIGSLDAQARDNLYRLARSVLRHGTSLFLEFSASLPDVELELPEPAGLTRRFDPEWLRREIEESGGVVEFLEIAPGTDMFDQPDPAVARLRAVWPR